MVESHGWSIAECLQHWNVWLQQQTLQEARFSDLRRDTPDNSASKITVRPVLVREQILWQVSTQQGPQVFHRNLSGDELLAECTVWLRDRFHEFRAEISTATINGRSRTGAHWKITEAAKSQPNSAATTEPAPHNRSKAYLIPEGVPCPFLAEIGVMNAAGKVLAAKSHKFRQINRFLELVADVLPDWPVGRPVRVIDFGAGKSYLTFALHHLLSTVRGWQTDITGIDHNPTVMADCQQIADRLACRGLSFTAERIEAVAAQSGVDLVVSLHACDTATDAALAQAVRWGAPLILAVPCCQHEFHHTMQPAASLTVLNEHGLLRERFAALATDAVRANLLEQCGYHTQVVEFIDLEHTPKNLLLRCVQRSVTPEHLARKQAEYAAFKSLLGLTTPTLERLLCERLRASPSLNF